MDYGGPNDPVFCVSERLKKRCMKSGVCCRSSGRGGSRLKGILSVTMQDLCKMAQDMGLQKELGQRFMLHLSSVIFGEGEEQ
jgi:hypothetical protein